jgi:DNA replication protein DnaD
LQPGGVFYNIFQDLANIAKNFDGKGFENLGKVSIVGTFTTDMLKGSDNFKDIMKNIQKGIDNLSKPQSMTTVANALETISNAGDISHKFDPIYELIEKSVSIHSTAQDLESIANSYNKIAAAEKIGDMSSKFKGVFGIKSSTPSTAAAPVAAANNSRSSGMSIEEILNDWYENGVKIKQNLEGLPEEPKPVNLLSID